MSHGAARRYVLEAFFDEPEPARHAVIALESKGIDADDIRVIGPDAIPSRQGERTGEAALARDVGGRAIRGAVVGGVIGAAVLVGALLALAVADTLFAVVFGSVIGAIPGALLGGYYNVARRLPVTDEAYDTYQIDAMDDAPVRVEVLIDDKSRVDEAAEALWEQHPRRVEHRRSGGHRAIT